MTHPSSITRRFSGAALAGAVLFGAAGCGKIAEKASEKIVEKGIEAGTGGKVDIDSKGGGFSVETDEGSMRFDADEGGFRMESDDGSYQAGSGMPDDWPSDVPLPPGFEPLTGHTMKDGDTENLSVQGAVGGDGESVMAFYDDALSGWKEENRTSMGSDEYRQLSTHWSKGDRTISVMVFEDAEDGTTAIIGHVVGGS